MSASFPAATVCVIIPTFNRKDFIAESIPYLLKSEYPHDKIQIFLSDGGSTDGSEDLIRELQKTSDIRITWYSDRSLRVSAARTYAIEHTEAEILLFLDDDCLTRPDWISSLVAPLVEGRAEITAGTDMAPPDDPFMALCEDVVFGSLIGSGGVRQDPSKSKGVEFCPMSCNMAMKRKTMLDLGCFDNALRFVEDTDFVYRAREAGCRVLFVPEATVLHRRRATVRGVCHHNYVRGYGRAYLHKKYPKQRQYAFFLPSIALVVGVLLAMAAPFFTWAAWTLALGGAAYLLIILAPAVEGLRRTGNPLAVFVVPFLTAMHHLWYAIAILHAPLTGYRKVFDLNRINIADPFGRREKGRA